MAVNDDMDSGYSGEIDPEIAELIGIDDDAEDQPGFQDLFGSGDATGGAEPEAVDLKRESFPAITAFDGPPRPFFADKSFYKTALGGEGAPAQRFHSQLAEFLKCEDPQEKSLLRGRVISAFWNLAEGIAAKSHVDLPDPKRVALRFGAVLPTLISAEQRAMIQKVIFENSTGEPVHYVDEWLHKVARGQVNASATDEIKAPKKNEGSKVTAQLDKTRGIRDTHFGSLSGKLNELEQVEGALRLAVEHLLKREFSPVYPNLKLGYTSEQRMRLSEIGNLARQIANVDKEVDRLFIQLDNATEQLDGLEDQAKESGIDQSVDASVVIEEYGTVKQMAKLCVGRQGNHMPVLMKQYFRASIRDIGTRENVITELAAAEAIDPGIFLRTFKRQTNRIVPHVILVPCYGDAGVCWEPFERFNRATSRGRIAIPMFPKDLKSAVIAALADLRWQVAKEKAQHYWMEEGLTGKYYQWFTAQKRRGDVRESFIQDYLLWITKESEGTQKLDREVRGVFWREVPFAQELKESLKNRGFVYSELYKKDKNREKSDGY